MENTKLTNHHRTREPTNRRESNVMSPCRRKRADRPRKNKDRTLSDQWANMLRARNEQFRTMSEQVANNERTNCDQLLRCPGFGERAGWGSKQGGTWRSGPKWVWGQGSGARSFHGPLCFACPGLEGAEKGAASKGVRGQGGPGWVWGLGFWSLGAHVPRTRPRAAGERKAPKRKQPSARRR